MGQRAKPERGKVLERNPKVDLRGKGEVMKAASDVLVCAHGSRQAAPNAMT